MHKHRKDRLTFHLYRAVGRDELTESTVEVDVWCYGDIDHRVEGRRGPNYDELLADEAYVGTVTQDIGKIRCPRCDYKITDIRRGSTDTYITYEVPTRGPVQ